MPSLSEAMVITLALLPVMAAAFVGAAVLAAKTMPRKARMVAYAVAVVAAVVVTVWYVPEEQDAICTALAAGRVP